MRPVRDGRERPGPAPRPTVMATATEAAVVELDTAVGELLAEAHMEQLFVQNTDLLSKICLVAAVGKT